ncbi:cycloartenol synthase-like isoform X2 [Punica granatum]|uniref:Terpene cyclase/mutase family member n=1 Tax=Punica granatum TaxID=22663 RepID=A0A6P8BUP5_PUNGR|nr:cycloartenol synthase-like isoform X2 [Punica granatum]
MWKLELSQGNDSWLTSVNNFIGRQVWEFDESPKESEDEYAKIKEARNEFTKHRFQAKQSSDLLMRLQFGREKRLELLPQIKVEEGEEITEEAVRVTLRRALRFYSTLQSDDGFWPGDYGGPLFLLPVLVIALHVTGALKVVLSNNHQLEMRRYLYNHQNEDSGWGLHIEGSSTMFGTVLCYVTLRLLGEEIDDGDGAMDRARKWILNHGGATYIPSWGKMFLSVLGVYEWSGNNPLPPEIWLLPYFLPIQPGRLWCHCRMVYLPMSYLYGKRFVGPIDSTVLSLRRELYTTCYHQINWDKTRNLCAKEDLYYPHTVVQDILWGCLHKIGEPFLMHWPFSRLRQKALAVVLEHIHYEDENTQYLCLGPVNKMLNMICSWVEDPKSAAYKRHLSRIKDYLWLAEDGMKMQGYNGSQLWDVTFAVQAILSTGLVDEYGSTLKKAHDFIKNTQIRENSSGDLSQWYRHISGGGWPFSTPDNGWPVSDCSSEGLKAALLLSKMLPNAVGDAITEDRLYDAVNLVLSLQNKNGGFASYELTRSYTWLEMINPAEIFGNIMIDYPYAECTSAAIQALVSFVKQYPTHRREEVDLCIAKAISFIESIQLLDGSWYGSWGVCFTYGTWFGVKGLVAGGKTYENSSSIRRACNFLLSKQLDSGGWGESYLSSHNKKGSV